MRSWDLFDTLITRRCIYPFTDERNPMMEREALDLIPIKENVRQVAAEDIIVSDMYLPQEWLQDQLKRVTGLTNRIFVSRGGKATGKIWGSLPTKPEEHIGDNYHTDIVSAEKAGIRSRHVVQAMPTADEQWLIEVGLHSLAQCSREARLTTWDNDHRALQLCQSQHNLPMLILMATGLDRWADQNGVESLLVCGRDGMGLYNVARGLSQKRVLYVESSRLCRTRRSLNYANYIRDHIVDRTAMVDLCGTGWSLRVFKEWSGLDIRLYVCSRYRGLIEQQYEDLIHTESEVAYLIEEASEPMEQANLASYPMVIDVDDDRFLVYSKLEYDYRLIPEIRVMHDVLFNFVTSMHRYDWSELYSLSDDALRQAARYQCQSLYRYEHDLRFLADQKREEERYIQSELTHFFRAGNSG